MTDTDRILELLKEHGSVTSYELRVQGFSGNPSQRMNELRERGHEIDAERFHREGRPCCRYKLRASTTPSLVGSKGIAAQTPRQDDERAGGDDLTPSAPHLPDRSEVAGEANSTIQVDVHRSPLKVASGSETPAISDRSCLNPYEYEAEAA